MRVSFRQFVNKLNRHVDFSAVFLTAMVQIVTQRNTLHADIETKNLIAIPVSLPDGSSAIPLPPLDVLRERRVISFLLPYHLY